MTAQADDCTEKSDILFRHYEDSPTNDDLKMSISRSDRF